MTATMRRAWRWFMKPERITGRMLQEHIEELSSSDAVVNHVDTCSACIRDQKRILLGYDPDGCPVLRSLLESDNARSES